MTAVYPSLDIGGFVNDPDQIATYLMGAYLATNYSQSNLFLGSLSSLQYTIQSNPNNPTGLATAIESQLTQLYTRYLSAVSVSVSAVPLRNPDGTIQENVYEIVINVEYRNGNNLVTLGRALRLHGTQIKGIVNITRE